jgi:hypothetical protein
VFAYENFMLPELQQLIGWDKYYQDNLIELSRRLPPEDDVVAEWIEAAAQRRDIYTFVFLLYAALTAGRKLKAQLLLRGLQLLPREADVVSAAFKLEGDVAGTLIETVQKGGLAPGRKALTLMAIVLWSQDRGVPVPAAVIPEARGVARKHWKADGVRIHINALALLTGDEALRAIVKEKHPDLAPEKFAEMEAATQPYVNEMRKLAGQPVLDLVPKVVAPPSRVMAEGTTMRRAVARVGRNEPCPCGSGKKYKHCCISRDNERLHRSSHVAGKTREELERSPEPPTTEEGFQKMPIHQVALLDPLKIRPDMLGNYFVMLMVRGMTDLFIPAFKKIEAMVEPDGLEELWYIGLFLGVQGGYVEFVGQLMEMKPYVEKLMEDNKEKRVLFGARLLLNQDNPGAAISLLAEEAMQMLDERHGETLQSFAHWLMQSPQFKAAGVLVARGLIPMMEKKEGAFLLKQILNVRDKLNLPADDPASDMVDRMLLKNDETPQDDQEAGSLRKAQRNLEKKAAEVRELKESLASLQRTLDLREKKEKRSAGEDKPGPSSEEKKETEQLRARLEQMKSTLKQTHGERNEFRRELEKAQGELDELRAAKPKPGGTDRPDHEESLLLPPEPVSNQPVRMLEFPKKFDEILHSVPRHIARNTMVTLGQIAGGEPAGFVGARRLNVCEDITRQRIGSDYRLLFRLLPDRVQVVTLINRRDLDRTIKSLA